MEGKMLKSHCKAIERSLKGVRLNFIKASTDGCRMCAIMLKDVSKLMENTVELGKYYRSQMVEKCQELERTREDVKCLSLKLQQQVEGIGNACHTPTQNSDVSDAVDEEEEPREREIDSADFLKCVEDLSTLRGTNAEILKSLEAKSKKLDRSLKALLWLKGELDGARFRNGELQERVREMTALNEFLSQELDVNRKRTGEMQERAQALARDQEELQQLRRSELNLKCCLLAVASKQSFAPSEYEEEISKIKTWSFDDEIKACLETIFRRGLKCDGQKSLTTERGGDP